LPKVGQEFKDQRA